MKKMKYIKPAIAVLGMELCNVVCASPYRANWGNKTTQKWYDEGYSPSGTPSGVEMDDDEGVIDSRSKKHSWSAWDD